jgi:hypothetical protein
MFFKLSFPADPDRRENKWNVAPAVKLSSVLEDPVVSPDPCFWNKKIIFDRKELTASFF